MHKRDTMKYLKLLTLPNSELKIKIYGSKFYAMLFKGIEPQSISGFFPIAMEGRLAK